MLRFFFLACICIIKYCFYFLFVFFIFLNFLHGLFIISFFIFFITSFWDLYDNINILSFFNWLGENHILHLFFCIDYVTKRQDYF